MTRGILLILLGCGAIGALAAAVFPPASSGTAWILVQLVALALTSTAVIRLFRATLAEETRSYGGALRGVAYLMVGACIVQIVRFSPFELTAWSGLMAIAAAIGAAGLLWLPAKRGGLARTLDWLIGVALLLVVGMEIALRVIAWIQPVPLFEQRDAAPAEVIQMHRIAQGTRRFGFPANENGFYDTAFVPTRAKQVLVVGDSFCTGVVHHGLHYTSIVETELADVDVWNMGLPELAPREYAELLRTQGLALKPDLVVVALNVGDDPMQTATPRFESGLERALAKWFDRGNVLAWQVAARVRRVMAERHRLGAQSGIQGEFVEEAIPDPATARARLPWHLDPSKEEPTWSSERFAEFARERVAANHGEGSEERIARVTDAVLELVAMSREAGVRCAVLLIPARYQVDDVLWESVRGETQEADRFEPQRQIVSRLVEAERVQGRILVVDVLPILRSATAAQGSPTYHEQDFHWNASGNRAAGEALAAALRLELQK